MHGPGWCCFIGLGKSYHLCQSVIWLTLGGVQKLYEVGRHSDYIWFIKLKELLKELIRLCWAKIAEITVSSIKLQVLNLKLKISELANRQPRIMHYKLSIVKMTITLSSLQIQWNPYQDCSGILWCFLKKSIEFIWNLQDYKHTKQCFKLIKSKGVISSNFKAYWMSQWVNALPAKPHPGSSPCPKGQERSNSWKSFPDSTGLLYHALLPEPQTHKISD